MIEHHLTGAASLVLALTALLHALRATLPEVVRAMHARAESARLDAETRAKREDARELAERDLRGRLDRCDSEHAETRAEMERRGLAHAAEIGALRGQLAALHDELADLRRSITAGHTPARRQT